MISAYRVFLIIPCQQSKAILVILLIVLSECCEGCNQHFRVLPSCFYLHIYIKSIVLMEWAVIFYVKFYVSFCTWNLSEIVIYDIGKCIILSIMAYVMFASISTRHILLKIVCVYSSIKIVHKASRLYLHIV